MTTTTDYDPFAIFGNEVEDGDRMWADFQAAAGIPAPVEPAPVVRCIGCDRPVRSAEAIARGYGAGCWRKAHRRARLAALTADYTDRQIDDAVELVEDGGVIHLRGQVFLTVGHRGDTYRTTTRTCNCARGLAGKPCFHSAAVTLVAGVESTTRTAIALPGVFAVAA